MPAQEITRRELAAAAWFPFLSLFRRRSVGIAGNRFRIVRKGEDRRHYLWIHGNEQTARQVLLKHLTHYDGVGFLIQSKERNIPVDGGFLDPNRMFSAVGAAANLKSLNTTWTDEQVRRAVARLDRDRPDLLKEILPKDGDLLVALHNNSPTYSVQDEIPISDEVSLNNPDHPHEFMLCTQKQDFGNLAKSRFNVVLQNRVPPTDDGSLSRLAAARGVRYVNIEAAHGNALDQALMLSWVELALER